MKTLLEGIAVGLFFLFSFCLLGCELTAPEDESRIQFDVYVGKENVDGEGVKIGSRYVTQDQAIDLKQAATKHVREELSVLSFMLPEHSKTSVLFLPGNENSNFYGIIDAGGWALGWGNPTPFVVDEQFYAFAIDWGTRREEKSILQIWGNAELRDTLSLYPGTNKIETSQFTEIPLNWLDRLSENRPQMAVYVPDSNHMEAYRLFLACHFTRERSSWFVTEFERHTDGSDPGYVGFASIEMPRLPDRMFVFAVRK